MPRDTQPAGTAGTESTASAAANAPPFVPTYRVGTVEKGEDAGKRSVLVTQPDGAEKAVSEESGRATGEAWAELRGDVDPVLSAARPRAAHTEFRRFRYLAARVRWGGEWSVANGVVTHKQWSPGAEGREMTLAEYDAFVRLGTDGTNATSSGTPPKAKE